MIKATRILGLTAVLMTTVAACSKEDAATVVKGEASGEIDIAVGGEVRHFGLAEAACEPVDAHGQRFLSVVAPAADKRRVDGKLVRPDLLTARLPTDLGASPVTFGASRPNLGAIASVIDGKYADEPYRLIQVIARATRPHADYTCQASRHGQKIDVKCNDAAVFPWFTSGEVPVGSFRATVVCEKQQTAN